MPRRTPEETLAAVTAHADDAEMESVLAMTSEERHAELRAAGFDVEAGNAKADALRMAALAASGSVTPIRKWRPGNVAMLVAAAFALFGGLVVVVNNRDPNAMAIPPRELLEAADLRDQAADACRAKKLSECVDLLERARVLYPAGDKSEDAQAIHQQIEALRREQGGH
jgi:hypothetical protein